MDNARNIITAGGDQMADINVQFVNGLPASFHGACTSNEDGSYTIVLDPNDSVERQQKAYSHEIEHIKKDHFSGPCADQAEADARTA